MFSSKTKEQVKEVSRGETCPDCKREQVDDGGKCAWCMYDIFNQEQFEAELKKEDPDLSDFYHQD